MRRRISQRIIRLLFRSKKSPQKGVWSLRTGWRKELL